MPAGGGGGWSTLVTGGKEVKTLIVIYPHILKRYDASRRYEDSNFLLFFFDFPLALSTEGSTDTVKTLHSPHAIYTCVG